MAPPKDDDPSSRALSCPVSLTPEGSVTGSRAVALAEAQKAAARIIPAQRAQVYTTQKVEVQGVTPEFRVMMENTEAIRAQGAVGVATQTHAVPAKEGTKQVMIVVGGVVVICLGAIYKLADGPLAWVLGLAVGGLTGIGIIRHLRARKNEP